MKLELNLTPKQARELRILARHAVASDIATPGEKKAHDKMVLEVLRVTEVLR